MTRAEIQSLLQPRIRKNAFPLSLWVWFYVAVTAGTLILHGINIHGYWTNPTMLAVQIAATLLSLAFLGYGIYLIGEIGRMERADESVLATLRRRLHFHRTKFEVWMWIIAATVYLLQFAINTMIDNDGGVYRINQPAFFVGVSVGLLALMYAVMKIAQYPVVRELRAMTSDLENEVTDNTRQVEGMRRAWLRWNVLIAIILSGFLIWGILAAV